MAKFIEKLRSLSEKEKKIVILTVVIGIGLILGFYWIKSAANGFSKLQQANLPAVELPQDAKEALDDAKNQAQNAGKTIQETASVQNVSTDVKTDVENTTK